MPNPAVPDDAVLQRRRFLRGSALLAAAAGGAVAAAAGATPASAADVNELTIALPSERMLDTKASDGRDLIIGSSEGAFDSKHRLKKNAWLDLAIYPSDAGVEVVAAFVNLTSLSSTSGGTLSVSEPGIEPPSGVTLTFSKGKTVSNGAFSGAVESGTYYEAGLYIIRIWATAVTHVRLDVTGMVLIDSGTGGSGDRRAVRAGLQRVKAAVQQARR